MINLKNFLKTTVIFSCMVTIVPDAKPMELINWAASWVYDSTPKFNAQNLTVLAEEQQYTALRPLFEAYLSGPQSDLVFELIQELRFQKNDQYALYMDIFNFVDTRRKKAVVGKGQVLHALKGMMFQMLQLPGEIACCLVRGDNPIEDRTNVYELFRETYAHWFVTYLCQNKSLFDAQDAYEYKKVLKEALAYKKLWDDQKTSAPHAVWVRHCKADPKASHRILFDTPLPAEHTGFETEEAVMLDARQRKQCWEEAVKVASDCKSWEDFFNLKLKELIPTNFAKVTKMNIAAKRSEDQAARNSATQSDASVNNAASGPVKTQAEIDALTKAAGSLTLDTKQPDVKAPAKAATTPPAGPSKNPAAATPATPAGTPAQ